jgi:hypothetical protein
MHFRRWWRGELPRSQGAHSYVKGDVYHPSRFGPRFLVGENDVEVAVRD